MTTNDSDFHSISTSFDSDSVSNNSSVYSRSFSSTTTFQDIRPLKTTVGFEAAFESKTIDIVGDEAKCTTLFPRHAFQDSVSQCPKIVTKRFPVDHDSMYQIPTAEQKKLIENHINVENQQNELPNPIPNIPSSNNTVQTPLFIRDNSKSLTPTAKSVQLIDRPTKNISPISLNIKKDMKLNDSVASEFLSLFNQRNIYSRRIE
ncbi:hypothetical protein HDV02_005707 [Globomyces sp. JEL0801]|nr:hypothetical protein HDV02_005707 [Globomyces sp. JEL0801]